MTNDNTSTVLIGSSWKMMKVSTTRERWNTLSDVISDLTMFVNTCTLCNKVNWNILYWWKLLNPCVSSSQKMDVDEYGNDQRENEETVRVKHRRRAKFGENVSISPSWLKKWRKTIVDNADDKLGLEMIPLFSYYKCMTTAISYYLWILKQFEFGIVLGLLAMLLCFNSDYYITLFEG